MRADVLQAVALCCHAQSYLRGAEDVPELLTNSTFSSVNEVRFERSGTTKLSSGLVADAPGPWLRRLKKEGVDRLSLCLASCPFDPMTIPADPWGIRSDGDVGVEIWEPSWRKRIRSHSDTSPWRVTYASTRGGRWLAQKPFGFADTKKLLHSLIRQSSEIDPLLGELESGDDAAYSDLYPHGWPQHLAALGSVAARVVRLLRSEDWQQVQQARVIAPADYEALSMKLWMAALIALETSASLPEGALELPRVRLAG